MSLRRHNPKRDGSESSVVQALKECGVRVFRLSQKGIPDLLCFFDQGNRSRCFLVEVKSSKTAPLTPDQVLFHKEASFRGWPVFIVSEAEAVLGIINQVMKS